MKKIIPVLIFSLALGGCLKKKTPEDMQKASSKPFKGSMMAAAKLGVPFKCTYSMDGEESSEGYIQGKNYRGMSKNPETGESAEVLMKDNCMWTWESGKEDGITMCYEEEESNEMFWEEMDEESMTEDLPEGVTIPEVEFDCNPSVIGPNTFTPPSDVTFMDMGEFMKQTMGEFGNLDYESMDSNVDVEKMMEKFEQ